MTILVMTKLTKKDFHQLCPRGYITLPIETVEAHAFERTHAKPNFPYLSFRQLEALKVIHAIKIAERNVVDFSVFVGEEGSTRMTVTSANRRLKGMVDKGYLEMVKTGRPVANYYHLTEMGFRFLRHQPYSTDFSPKQWARITAVNKVFTRLCETYRVEKRGNIGWETEPEVTLKSGEIWKPMALSAIWENGECTQAKAYIVLDSIFVEELEGELSTLRQTYEKLLEDDTVKAFDVVIVSKDTSEEIPFISNGEFMDLPDELYHLI